MKNNFPPIRETRTISLFFSVCLFSLASLASGQGAKATAELTLSPTALDFAGSRQTGTMYMPSGIDLTAAKPAGIKKEPNYLGSPLYGVLRVGNGPRSNHVVALDVPASGDPKIYVDLNADGDLTNDGAGQWPIKQATDRGFQYSGTFLFRSSYGTATKETSSGTYGLNFYWTPGRSSIFYYRASIRTGSIKVGGQTYSVKVIENNNDGVYNTPFVQAGKPTKPVWLDLDGGQFDARGTFGLDGYNYLATLSADGSKLTLEPTAKSVTAPKLTVTKEPTLLALGVEAPDFEVPAAKGGTVRLSSLRGQVVVLDFWATWCGPCKASLPHVQKVYDRVKDKNVYVLALNVLDEKQAYDEWLPANSQYKFHFAYDPAGRGASSIATSKYNVAGIPTTYVIGPDGKVASEIVGFDGLDDHRLEDALKKLGVTL